MLPLCHSAAHCRHMKRQPSLCHCCPCCGHHHCNRHCRLHLCLHCRCRLHLCCCCRLNCHHCCHCGCCPPLPSAIAILVPVAHCCRHLRCIAISHCHCRCPCHWPLPSPSLLAIPVAISVGHHHCCQRCPLPRVVALTQ